MRDQLCLASRVSRLQHDRALNVRVLQQNVLDLLGLDPVAADLHLVVDAAEALKRPVGAPTGQISGPVQTRRATFRERVAKELLLGLFRIVEVAATDADAADTELACNSDWHRLRMRIEHIESCVGYGAADRHVGELTSVQP